MISAPQHFLLQIQIVTDFWPNVVSKFAASLSQLAEFKLFWSLSTRVNDLGLLVGGRRCAVGIKIKINAWYREKWF